MNMMGSRGKYIWLGLVGILVLLMSLASVSGTAAISPVVALTLVVAYLATAYVMIRGVDLSAVQRQVKEQTQSSKMTATARRATQRARNRADYGIGSNHVLADIGLLINDRRRDGRWNRRIAESASFDDGAAQPYIKLRVAPDFAGQTSLIEFEFYDRSGKLQFSHRMEEYLRDGENLILCERQLPLRDSTERGRAGTWDLRVKVDGSTVGVHEFNMSGSSTEQQAYEAARPRNVLNVPEDDDEPVSLEDLLREQARRSSGKDG